MAYGLILKITTNRNKDVKINKYSLLMILRNLNNEIKIIIGKRIKVIAFMDKDAPSNIPAIEKFWRLYSLSYRIFKKYY